MTRARRHHRALSVLAFCLLALVAELAGRSLTHRFDVGRHVQAPGYAHTDYYPFLVGAVKVGVALLVARLAWRFAKARSAARAAERLLGAVGSRPSRTPRVRLELSPKLAALAFALTSVVYLVQANAEGVAASPLSPWVHSSALPVFAVLAVAVALFWRAVAGWLADYESYAAQAVAAAHLLAAADDGPSVPRPPVSVSTVRRLFGVVFESRPPPVPA